VERVDRYPGRAPASLVLWVVGLEKLCIQIEGETASRLVGWLGCEGGWICPPDVDRKSLVQATEDIMGNRKPAPESTITDLRLEIGPLVARQCLRWVRWRHYIADNHPLEAETCAVDGEFGSLARSFRIAWC
jgi:hypothetical protein